MKAFKPLPYFITKRTGGGDSKSKQLIRKSMFKMYSLNAFYN